MGAIPIWLQRQRTVWRPLRTAVALVGLPTVLVGMACVPGLNALLFSAHGGPGWFALALSFPVLLLNTYRLVIRPGRRAGASPWRRSAAICLAYVVLAYPFAMLAEHRIARDSGLPIADRFFYRVMTLPIGLVIP
jgi:hypothetical protein